MYRALVPLSRTVAPVSQLVSMSSRQFCAESLLGSVQHDTKNKVFVLPVDDLKAELMYSKKNSIIHLDHTIVPDELGGRGLGKILAKVAFDYVADNNLKMIIHCDFLQHYLEKYGAQYKQYEV